MYLRRLCHVHTDPNYFVRIPLTEPTLSQVTDTDIQLAEKKYVQTLEMIASKKKRIVLEEARLRTLDVSRRFLIAFLACLEEESLVIQETIFLNSLFVCFD